MVDVQGLCMTGPIPQWMQHSGELALSLTVVTQDISGIARKSPGEDPIWMASQKPEILNQTVTYFNVCIVTSLASEDVWTGVVYCRPHCDTVWLPQ